MRFFYWIRAKYRRWNYKRKYGISIDEGISEYGRYIILSEKKDVRRMPNKKA